ncbi:hypothetical protein [Parasphingorhabdus halotolerans]|uniref:hypothetical protein n=1 Tax=Parasphingorhabdus halotolerans TaxID=2725558 RepID=UPI001FE66667|nr:hypothetical protein [Parasphingorhabdus halotolerans]
MQSPLDECAGPFHQLPISHYDQPADMAYLQQFAILPSARPTPVAFALAELRNPVISHPACQSSLFYRTVIYDIIAPCNALIFPIGKLFELSSEIATKSPEREYFETSGWIVAPLYKIE